MAKSKNHTNHNDTQKAHKNGVRKAKPLHLFKAVRGSWLPALVNARKVRKANSAAAVEARKQRLAKVQAAFGKK
jgi:large subunit ribosomal protein L29e|eukprot:CAMPEP_0205832792 /NCGR_PEP_ID=MMETSP0206-20130828/47905_1 /ASSEMBLY_ACC=CAM_ASM_000279 /TAXON_ID=36767 /ORGANISM="Euplotes focardii, Strain TN1" /LENGTH=73 /DNA_ID=CAMNT_0053138627 /DNA_START=1 /DNA_END=222 /DNA_ORIENTATION=+